jgi:hypothetical protein
MVVRDKMKLIYCPVCDDIFRLVTYEWCCCRCGRSGGQYNADNLTAVIGGKGKVFGIPNPFFFEGYMAAPEDIIRLRHKYNDQWITDIWWGEYAGDWQLIRVNNPLGPIPTNWFKRVEKLKKAGGVKGYDTPYEQRQKENWRTQALLRKRATDLGRALWNRLARIWDEA